MKFELNDNFDFQLFIFTAILLSSANFITVNITSQLIDNDILSKKKELFQLFDCKSNSELKIIEDKFREQINNQIVRNIQLILLESNQIIEIDALSKMIDCAEIDDYISKIKLSFKSRKNVKNLLKYYNTNYTYNYYFCKYKSGELVHIPHYNFHLSYIVSILLSFFAAFGYSGWSENTITKVALLGIMIIIEVVSSVISFKSLKREKIKELENFKEQFNEKQMAYDMKHDESI